MNRFYLLILLTLLHVAAFSSSCLAGQKLAVMDFFVKPGVEEAKVKIITDTLLEELGNSGIFESIRTLPSDATLIDFLEKPQTLAVKQLKIQEQSDYLVGGVVSKLGPESYVLNVKLLDVQGDDAVVVKSENALCDCMKMNLIHTTRKIAANLIGDELSQHLAVKIAANTLSGAEKTGTDGRFVAYSNGTVIDTKSGLMWAAVDNGADINWQDAKKYCDSYAVGGHHDWRLPTIAELESLLTTPESNTSDKPDTANMQITPLVQLSNCCPWTGETRNSMAAFYNFPLKYAYWDYQINSYCARVLPVRNGY